MLLQAGARAHFKTAVLRADLGPQSELLGVTGQNHINPWLVSM
jgi:hypothetical protein